ncbi:MAG TPA: M20/M25/M40 family metallo-hydrolase, partial [Vicinamibacteria bacterium]
MMKTLALTSAAILVSASAYPEDDVLARIREEGFQRSQVMDFAFYMTDVLGPRVTSSRGEKKAQEWAQSKMRDMGLSRVVAEPFAAHEASWDNLYTSLHLLEPDYQPLIGYPYAFTPGTNGKVTAEAKIAVIRAREDFDRYRGKLKGAVVLTAPPRSVPPRFVPDAVSFSSDELRALSESTIASRFGAGAEDYVWDERAMAFVLREESRDLLAPSRKDIEDFRNEVQTFYKSEGVAAVLDPAPGRDGTVFVDGRPGSRYDRSLKGALEAPVRIALEVEHYNRIYRLVDRGIPAKLEIEVRNQLDADDPQARNVLGDVPGTDLANELVMVGGHFDSWHAGTGATDDAAGCAAVLEAVRILKAIGVTPRRTIRVALWSWEEGGKVGSRRYVEEHFGPNAATAGGETLSVYFNMDNGTGQFRGVYLHGNERARALFSRWMSPLRDLKMDTLTIDHTFGIDV